MELLQAILNRRTVRAFNSKPVAEETINKILEAGTWAPSHGNNQPWEFIIIGPDTRKKLADAYKAVLEAGPLKNPSLPEQRKDSMRRFAQDFGSAPLLLAVVNPPAGSDMDKYDFPLASGAAIQNMFLAAWEYGVAGVWLSYGYNPQAPSILGLGNGEVISGILAMGYPENIPEAQPRIPAVNKLRRVP